jgi:hypothetical protein
MGEVEYHRVDAMPDPERVLSEIPRALSFLLTRLLSHDRALLHAECRRGTPEMTWYVRQRTDASEGQDVPVATVPWGIVSSMISRVALAFDIDYTTGGYGRGTLLFEGRRFDCRVFLSKCSDSGYWIRIYAAAAQPAVALDRAAAKRLL